MAIINPIQFTTKKSKLITIRNCEDQDLVDLHNFQDSIARESTHTMMAVNHPRPPLEKIKANWDDLKKSEKGLIIGAFDGDKIVGQLVSRQERPGHPWCEHLASFGMFLLQDYWGQGIGHELLKNAAAHAKSVGINKIEGHVRTQNERGLALYLKFGFQVEGLRKRAAFINGHYQDEYFIGKILK